MGTKISNKELYGYFKYTLQNCQSSNLQLDDISIEYYFLEEFIANVEIFLREDMLEMLWFDGYINEEIYELSRLLYKKNTNIKKDGLLSVSDVKNNKNWGDLAEASDKILKVIEEWEMANFENNAKNDARKFNA